MREILGCEVIIKFGNYRGAGGVMERKERKGKERKGKERKGKERKGKERKGKERKGVDSSRRARRP
jgi:hypothetical protein